MTLYSRNYRRRLRRPHYKRIWGSVEADSPEHAIKYLHSIGKYAGYEYTIYEVEVNPIQVATPMAELKHLKAKVRPGIVSDYKGEVK